jgi:protein O-GlcNAc transferase
MADRRLEAPELTPVEAQKHYERAVKDNPKDPQARLNLGSAYYVNGNLDAALKEFADALNYSPGLDHAHYYLGVIYAKRGDVTSARQELEHVVSSNGNILLKNQARIRLGQLGT